MSYQRKRSVSVNDRGHVVGQDHHRSRLSDHDIDLIRELRAGGMPLREIGEKFEISIQSVSYYARGDRRAQMAVDQKFVHVREPRLRPAPPGEFD
jgi:hypothetical protein